MQKVKIPAGPEPDTGGLARGRTPNAKRINKRRSNAEKKAEKGTASRGAQPGHGRPRAGPNAKCKTHNTCLKTQKKVRINSEIMHTPEHTKRENNAAERQKRGTCKTRCVFAVPRAKRGVCAQCPELHLACVRGAPCCIWRVSASGGPISRIRIPPKSGPGARFTSINLLGRAGEVQTGKQ